MNIVLIIVACIIALTLVVPMYRLLRWCAIWLWFCLSLAGDVVGILWAHWHPKREVITFRDGWGKLHRFYND